MARKKKISSFMLMIKQKANVPEKIFVKYIYEKLLDCFNLQTVVYLE